MRSDGSHGCSRCGNCRAPSTRWNWLSAISCAMSRQLWCVALSAANSLRNSVAPAAHYRAFTDVFGFTTMAESLEPEMVMAEDLPLLQRDRRRVHPVRRDHRQIYRRQRHGILECARTSSRSRRNGLPRRPRASRRLDSLNAEFLQGGWRGHAHALRSSYRRRIVGNVGSVTGSTTRR